MLISFENMADTSRVWIYQANRAFSAIELAEINTQLSNFIATWKRHGEDLKASFLIKYNQFIIIVVDENYNDVSGCSIDASVNFIKQIEKKYQIDLTNKLNISFKDGDSINVVPLIEFQNYAKQQKITSTTIVFNNLVTTKSEFLKSWEITAEKSWHKRFLSVPA